jgi:hypothetical protein
MLRQVRSIAVWLICLLGFAGVIMGFLANKVPGLGDSLQYQIASIVGAALFGASLSMLIGQILGTDIADIRNYLLSRERLESAPDHLDAVVGEWHHYDLSSVAGGRVWQYIKYTLNRGDMHNTVNGYWYQEGPTGRKRKYHIEAGVRGGALIAIVRADEGHEHDQIQIVPYITRTHLNAVAGIQIMETWDGELCRSYMIYSRTKLLPDDTISAKDAHTLDGILASLLERSKLRDIRDLELRQGA